MEETFRKGSLHQKYSDKAERLVGEFLILLLELRDVGISKREPISIWITEDTYILLLERGLEIGAEILSEQYARNLGLWTFKRVFLAYYYVHQFQLHKSGINEDMHFLAENENIEFADDDDTAKLIIWTENQLGSCFRLKCICV
jgi:hypothetical protein